MINLRFKKARVYTSIGGLKNIAFEIIKVRISEFGKQYLVEAFLDSDDSTLEGLTEISIPLVQIVENVELEKRAFALENATIDPVNTSDKKVQIKAPLIKNDTKHTS